MPAVEEGRSAQVPLSASRPAEQPVFSLIMPVYNVAGFLENSLQSLALQSLDNSLYEI